jgi:competence protein ComEC
MALAEPLADFLHDPNVLGRPSVAEMGAFAGLLLCLAASRKGVLLRRRARRLAVVWASLAAALLLLRLAPSPALEVWALPVGHGDATLLRLPSGHTLLIDTGRGSSHAGGRGNAVVSMLRGLGISHLDVIAITHGDSDHVGGLETIADVYPPSELWWAGPIERNRTLQAIAAELEINGTRLRRLDLGPTTIVIGRTEIEVLHPVRPHPELSDNDNSLCLRVEFEGRRVLLVGDVERRAESLLVSRDDLDLSADILKVPHHGSRTSSSEALLARVRPRYGVFSVGLHSRFGFPHADVEESYRRFDVRTFRTDHDGAVHFRLAAEGIFHESGPW